MLQAKKLPTNAKYRQETKDVLTLFSPRIKELGINFTFLGEKHNVLDNMLNKDKLRLISNLHLNTEYC